MTLGQRSNQQTDGQQRGDQQHEGLKAAAANQIAQRAAQQRGQLTPAHNQTVTP